MFPLGPGKVRLPVAWLPWVAALTVRVKVAEFIGTRVPAFVYRLAIVAPLNTIVLPDPVGTVPL